MGQGSICAKWNFGGTSHVLLHFLSLFRVVYFGDYIHLSVGDFLQEHRVGLVLGSKGRSLVMVRRGKLLLLLLMMGMVMMMLLILMEMVMLIVSTDGWMDDDVPW